MFFNFLGFRILSNEKLNAILGFIFHVEYFVFYFSGEDVAIISAIKEYCETFSKDETEGIPIIGEGSLSWKVI